MGIPHIDLRALGLDPLLAGCPQGNAFFGRSPFSLWAFSRLCSSYRCSVSPDFHRGKREVSILTGGRLYFSAPANCLAPDRNLSIEGGAAFVRLIAGNSSQPFLAEASQPCGWAEEKINKCSGPRFHPVELSGSYSSCLLFFH